MWINAAEITDNDIENSWKRMMNDTTVFTDMADYYSGELNKIHEVNLQQGTSSDIERQCHTCHSDESFEQLSITSQNSVHSQDGDEISNNQKTLNLVRCIYKKDN